MIEESSYTIHVARNHQLKEPTNSDSWNVVCLNKPTTITFPKIEATVNIVKGIVQWIFLSVYVVVLISGYTLLFIGTKTDQYFLRYLQKHARILAVLKKRFIQEITVAWKATCRNHYLSPSDITICVHFGTTGTFPPIPTSTFPYRGQSSDVTGGCSKWTLSERAVKYQKSVFWSPCRLLPISWEIMFRFCSGKKESVP